MNILKRALNVISIAVLSPRTGGWPVLFKGKALRVIQIFPEEFWLSEINMLQLKWSHSQCQPHFFTGTSKFRKPRPTLYENGKSFPRCLAQDIQRVSHSLLSSNYNVEALRVKSCAWPKTPGLRAVWQPAHCVQLCFLLFCSKKTMENTHHSIKAFLKCSTVAVYSCANTTIGGS